MAPLSWVVDSLLESPLVMRHTLRATPEPKLLAEVVTAFPADATGVAGHADLQGNPVPKTESGDLGPNANHNAGRLVAQ